MKVKHCLVIVVLLALSLLAGTTAFAGSAPTGQEPSPTGLPVITVAGTGKVMVRPDTASITLGVNTVAPTAQAAQKENSRIANQVLEALVKIGIPRQNIQTVDYSIWPEYYHPPYKEGSPEPPKVTAYRVINNIRVAVDDTSQLGAVIDAAVNAGANQSYNIQFSKKDEVAARSEALTKAVVDARSKAETVARTLGMKISKVLAVNVEGAYMPVIYRPMKVLDEGLGGGTPVEPGQLEISGSVQIQFALSE
ncbi:MAG: SIMPL domain-containing protein [Bacillota bacterium]